MLLRKGQGCLILLLKALLCPTRPVPRLWVITPFLGVCTVVKSGLLAQPCPCLANCVTGRIADPLFFFNRLQISRTCLVLGLQGVGLALGSSEGGVWGLVGQASHMYLHVSSRMCS